jgi:hypothetical protein
MKTDIHNEIKETGNAILNSLESKIKEINDSPLNDTQKKELIAMAEGIRESIANQDLESINKILNFA